MDKSKKFSLLCKIPTAPNGPPCAKEIWSGPTMQLPELGEEPREREQKIVQAVMNHMAKHHGPIAAQILATWKQFLGWNALGFVHTEDPSYPLFMGRFAAHLCRIACIRLSDQQIGQAVDNLFADLTPEVRTRITDQMRRQRDFITGATQIQLPLHPAKTGT